jgi:AcrR family transcriptional regulator
MREPVKGRTEAGRRREARARDTRLRVIEAAVRLFVARGYVATTVQAVAEAAGVAPATVYQAFGTKQAILAAALDVTVAGDDAPRAVLDRDWVAKARREQDPRRRLRLVVAGACRIAARTAPIKEVMRDAAATDPRVRDLIREDHDRRRLTQQALVDIAIGDTALRPGMTREQAADTFFVLVSSHNYLLVQDTLEWRLEDWQRWLVGVLTRELFGTTGGAT